MILLSELSRRRIRSIQKLIRVGRNEVVVVLRVDKEKGKQKKTPPIVSHDDKLTSIQLGPYTQATSTCRNVASHQKTLQNARSAS